LLGLNLERLEFDPGLAGATLENIVVMELRKQSSRSKTQPQLYYWRTASGQEVDIVLEDSTGQLVGIEVKASATLQREDLRGLQVLADAARKRWVRGVVLYAGTEIIPFANNLHGIPISSLWTTG
jgi:predicted AAA+ superfamily ATPase